MIYRYKYKKHSIEKFHEGMMFFYSYLFNHTPKTFDRELMFPDWFVPSMNASRKKFDPTFQQLIDQYYGLTAAQKNKVKRAFEINNQIEKLCNGELTPVKYSELEPNFSKTLKDFSKLLWNDYTHNKEVQKLCGTVKNHYDAFMDLSHQRAILCPFCGLGELKPANDKYREAYDHYLPKSVYPFTSMNFQNLVPTCHACNSDEKGKHEVIFQDGTRTKVIYPFSKELAGDGVSLEIVTKEKYDTTKKTTRLNSIKWGYKLAIGGKVNDQVMAWENIYGIQRRYQARMPAMETVWFDILKTRYKDSLEDSVSFVKFKARFLREMKAQILTMEKGLMRYSYFDYILSLEKIEEKLQFVISKAG